MHRKWLLLAVWSAALALADCACVDRTLVDGTTWEDSKGRDCRWYGARTRRCSLYGSKYKNDWVANEACCVCGGGHEATAAPTSVPTPTSIPTPEPSTAGPTAGPAPSCGPRVRRGWSMLSCAEREEYVAAVNALKTQKPSEYDDIASMHLYLTNYAHGTSAFLPWHRWFTVGYENALRSIPGYECITVPYWDWQRDDADESMSTPFRAKTFGTMMGVSGWPDYCVTDGAFAGWTASDGRCLVRNWEGAGFTGTMEMASIITTNNAFAGFWPTLEGNPHAAPHRFVGGNMGTLRSPDDPLFFVHHANVDRMWALWQDYHGHDTVPKADMTEAMYVPTPPTSGDPPVSELQLDSVMRFEVDSSGRTLPYFSSPVTFRDMHLITDMPGEGNSYTYGTDNLADVIGQPGSGTWDLVVPGKAPKVTCCGDGTVDGADQGGAEECDDGNTVDGDGCSAACVVEGAEGAGHTQVAPTKYLSDSTIEALFHKADEEREKNGGDKAAMLKKLAEAECKLHAADYLNDIPTDWMKHMNIDESKGKLFAPCGSLL